MAAKTVAQSKNRIVALFPSLLGVGGIQEASRLTAATLTEIAPSYGWSVDYLSLNDSPGHPSLPGSNAAIPFSAFGGAKVRFVASAMARARSETRIVLAAHPHLALPAAQMKLLQPKLKTVVISHGVEVWERLPMWRRLAFLKSDLFMAPSRYTIEQIIRVQGAPPEKMRRVAWPLSPSFVEMSEQREKLPLPSAFPRGLVVLSVARLVAAEKYKGVDQLIRAVAQLLPRAPELHLVVVGGGDDLPRHQRLAVELGVASRVHFLDALSPAETAACYARCDIFTLPSTGEGFGFVFLEAMAFAKPVIGAAAGGVTDIVEDGQNGLLVSQNDLGQLVKSLELLATNQSLRVELGQRGAQIVRSKYRFERFRSELEDVLRECGFASEHEGTTRHRENK
jgi:phosphatidyl-myo-inositol dimannoside synthase